MDLSSIAESADDRFRPGSRQSVRLFHGRGQTVPGLEHLVIDWHPPVMLITLYAPASAPDIDSLVQLLGELAGSACEAIVLQQRHDTRRGSRLLHGELPGNCLAREDDLVYAIEPLARQNVGFFPDMAAGRRLVRSLARGKKILNLFAYTCSISVAAIAGGAESTVNVDMNRRLLDRGRDNHLLNGQDLRRTAFLAHDVFKSFGKLRRLGPFDLVIADPPAWQENSFRADRDWAKLLPRLPGLMSATGEIVAAVSAPQLGRAFLEEQFAAALPEATQLAALTAGGDFPEADPDKGLQLLHYRLAAG